MPKWLKEPTRPAGLIAHDHMKHRPDCIACEQLRRHLMECNTCGSQVRKVTVPKRKGAKR